jgi:hypothetical protein
MGSTARRRGAAGHDVQVAALDRPPDHGHGYLGGAGVAENYGFSSMQPNSPAPKANTLENREFRQPSSGHHPWWKSPKHRRSLCRSGFVVACPYTQAVHMPLPMARPVKIKDSPSSQFRQRIPRDVLDKARGQTVTVEIGGRPVSYRIGPTGEVVKFSLRASDPTLVRSRHRAIAEHVSSWFDTLRAKQRGGHGLTRSRAAILAAEWYRWFTAKHTDAPGTAERWRLARELVWDEIVEATREWDTDPAGHQGENREEHPDASSLSDLAPPRPRITQ